MKKLLLTLFLSLVLVSNAGAVMVERTEVMDTDFDADTTSDTSEEVAVLGYEKVGFLIYYDETAVGNNPAVSIVVQISQDGTNWMTGYFRDFAGSDTLQASETITTDETYYYCWIDYPVMYVRLSVTASNTDEDDLIDLTAYLMAKE